MINARELIGTANVLFVTFDSLRYDVARAMMHAGRTPNLENVVAGGLWEERRTPGTFTFPAHAAFFAGFLPVPSGPARPPRLMACRAIQGKTIAAGTYVFDAPNIVEGFAGLGYRTVCVGGVGFFSQQTPLGRVFPALFQESHWSPDMASEEPHSTRNQVATALGSLDRLEDGQKAFLFMNLTATHTPTHFYLEGTPDVDTWESQGAALAYVDTQLGPLFEALPNYGRWLVVMCADHGEAFGEDGYNGHGVAHSTVMTVPYSESVIHPR